MVKVFVVVNQSCPPENSTGPETTQRPGMDCQGFFRQNGTIRAPNGKPVGPTGKKSMYLVDIPGNVRHKYPLPVKKIVRRPRHPCPLKIEPVTLFKRDDMDKSGGRDTRESAPRTVWRDRRRHFWRTLVGGHVLLPRSASR